MDRKGSNTFPFYNLPPVLRNISKKEFFCAFFLSLLDKIKDGGESCLPRYFANKKRKTRTSIPKNSQFFPPYHTLVLTILPFWRFDQISWGIVVQTWSNGSYESIMLKWVKVHEVWLEIGHSWLFPPYNWILGQLSNWLGKDWNQGLKLGVIRWENWLCFLRSYLHLCGWARVATDFLFYPKGKVKKAQQKPFEIFRGFGG